MFKTFKTFKSFKTGERPFYSSPAVAGEDKGGGLNGAKRLNGLNDLNRCMRISMGA